FRRRSLLGLTRGARREARLQFLVLGVDRTKCVHYLVKEVVDLVLVVPLTELRELELLVEDIIGCEQSHASSPQHCIGGGDPGVPLCKILTYQIRSYTTSTRYPN